MTSGRKTYGVLPRDTHRTIRTPTIDGAGHPLVVVAGFATADNVHRRVLAPNTFDAAIRVLWKIVMAVHPAWERKILSARNAEKDIDRLALLDIFYRVVFHRFARRVSYVFLPYLIIITQRWIRASSRNIGRGDSTFVKFIRRTTQIADSGEAGHAFQSEAGRCSALKPARYSDAKPATWDVARAGLLG